MTTSRLGLALSLVLIMASSSLTMAVPHVPTAAVTTGVVAFAASLSSSTACHRDGSAGCDLYLGDLNFTTGEIANTLLIDGSAGAQWFPALSPDGRLLAYSNAATTPDSIVIIDLPSRAVRQVITDGKFPAFSSDSARMYFSTAAQAIKVLTVASRVITTLPTVGPGSDPAPIGDRYVGYHEEVGGVATPIVHDLMTTSEIRPATSTRCGHVVVNPDQTRMGCAPSSSTRVWMTQLANGVWSALSVLTGPFDTAIVAAAPEFGGAAALFLGVGSWPTETVLVASVESAVSSGNPDRPFTTTRGRLFVIDLAPVTPALIPTVVLGYPDAQSYAPSVLAGQTMAGVIGVPTGTLPGAPTSVLGTVGNRQVVLSWTAPPPTGGAALYGYQVVVANAADGTYGSAAGCTSNTSSTATSCIATGLTNGTPYFFKVAAINVAGAGPLSTASAAITPTGPGTIALSSAVLNYSGVNTDGTLSPLTGAQTVTVTAAGNSDITWSATANQSWVQIGSGTGAGSGTFTLSIVNPSNVLAGVSSTSATITVTATNASNSPRTVTVNLTLQQSAQLQPPFGAFDTPVANATVEGSIAVTGWALDDVGINRVEIWRDLITNDPAPPFRENGHPADGKVFIANGVFSDGSRPDVDGTYTGAPFKQRSGWGYLLLTWGLPNANGTFVLTAIAWDNEGRSTVLGTKTIAVANSTATKPFGSIDVPAYGATFIGHQFTFGWALTPASGCNVAGGQQFMTIDSAAPNFPITYGASRTDIAAAFPSFSDSNAAGGAVALNSTNYTNGAHAIGWLVYDSCGNGEGIGSRFFQILNSGARARMAGDAAAEVETIAGGPSNAIVGRGPTFARAGQALDAVSLGESASPLWLVRGIARAATPLDRSATVWLSQTGRIEIHATDPRTLDQGPGTEDSYEAYLAVNGMLEPLPMGSSFDKATGTFSWQPVAGFLGAFPIRIFKLENGAAEEQWTTRVVVSPGVDDVLLQIDSAGSSVIDGWSLDPQATNGSGIGAVHVWATKKVSGITAQPFFIGQAVLGALREDVAARYGPQFNRAGYKLPTPSLDPGSYEVIVYAWSERTARWETARITAVTVR